VAFSSFSFFSFFVSLAHLAFSTPFINATPVFFAYMKIHPFLYPLLWHVFVHHKIRGIVQLSLLHFLLTFCSCLHRRNTCINQSFCQPTKETYPSLLRLNLLLKSLLINVFLHHLQSRDQGRCDNTVFNFSPYDHEFPTDWLNRKRTSESNIECTDGTRVKTSRTGLTIPRQRVPVYSG
jgi:hypothetical protein